ncbi:MAG TPA: hypothetical protein ENN67_07170 [Firmicutes bacterium]|nr:hypothetical protein [Bacillota bacterium]
MTILRKHLPIAVAFVFGVAMFFQFFIPSQQSSKFLEEVTNWVRIIAGFAILLGIYSLLNYHYHKIRRKVPGWGFSVVTYVGFFVMMLSGFIWPIQNPPPVTTAVGDTIQEYYPFMWIYENMFVPMQATMFSILAFYIASAAYRAFRARTREATVLLITAIIVMLGRVPLGALLIPWEPFNTEAHPQVQPFLAWFTEWILNNPSMAAQRGIMIGIGLGMIATSLRIIFGIERTYMGGGD